MGRAHNKEMWNTGYDAAQFSHTNGKSLGTLQGKDASTTYLSSERLSLNTDQLPFFQEGWNAYIERAEKHPTPSTNRRC